MSGTLIREGIYKDVEAIIFENELLEVVLIPSSGAKIASLKFKGSGYECLKQNPSEKFLMPSFDSVFAERECAGIDLMFPTVDTCEFPSDPYKGKLLSDHGEVWCLPWEYEIENDVVTCRVNGREFSYEMMQRISVNENKLRLEYEVKNLEEFSFPFIFAPHPLFNASAGMEIRLPKDMDRIINASKDSPLPDFLREFSYPVLNFNGAEKDFSVMKEKNDEGFYKFYFSKRVSEGWCELVDHLNGILFRMDYGEKSFPWFGFWINEGGIDGDYVIAPEPASAAMDEIGLSQELGMGSSLEPGELRSWFVEIGITEL